MSLLPMIILALSGHGQCGKSTTLNMLKELLREAGKSISSKPHPWSEAPETFEYKGLMICVAPGGDTRAVVERNVRYFKLKRCDVAISATRTKWGSVEALEEYAKEKGAEIEWIQKSYEYSLSEETCLWCNQETAKIIFDKL